MAFDVTQLRTTRSGVSRSEHVNDYYERSRLSLHLVFLTLFGIKCLRSFKIL